MGVVMNVKLNSVLAAVLLTFSFAQAQFPHRNIMISDYTPQQELELAIESGDKTDEIGDDAIATTDFNDETYQHYMQDEMWGELGYMHNGMPQHLPARIVADQNIDALFRRFDHLRNTSNVALPAEFNNLVGFIFGYIRRTATADAEKLNGITHAQLASEIVRASFCFGTDPFMVVSKIRRETSHSRTLVSSGSAVGFSQMTGAGIEEVQHQMSGNADISSANAKASFDKAIRCFVGPTRHNFTVGNRVQVQNQLKNNYKLDLIFGQILTKTYLSFNKAKNSNTTAKTAYSETFVLYNGDNTMVNGRCLGGKRTELKHEYACDIMSFYNRLNAVWANFLKKTKKYPVT
jgi:hypothetical protein